MIWSAVNGPISGILKLRIICKAVVVSGKGLERHYFGFCLVFSDGRRDYGRFHEMSLHDDPYAPRRGGTASCEEKKWQPEQSKK
jgi:hypothetical protein